MSSNIFKKLVDNSIASFESNAWTSLPAEVTAISTSGDQTIISVKPVIKRLQRGSLSKPLPAIHDVPVMWPSTSTSTVRGVLSEGDWVLLVFSCRPISNWLNSPEGNITDPESFQKMNYNSAIAVPGLFPFSKNVNTPSNQSLSDDQADMIVKSNIGSSKENEIRLKADGGVTITASGDGTSTVVTIAADGSMVINASAGLTLNGDLTVTGDIDSTGTVTATTDVVGGGKSLSTHTHLYTPGTGTPTQTSPTATPPPP